MATTKHAGTLCTTIVTSAALAWSLVSGPPAMAGMTDPESGETCWGAGCLDGGDDTLPAGSGSVSGSSAPFIPGNLTIQDCTAVDSARIVFAVDWLQDNQAAIDRTMRDSPALMDWPGNSREKFGEKLHKELKFVCIDQKKKCDRLWGRTVPVLAQQRVNLCAANINDDADFDTATMNELYVHVIAHEIGHLIRLNGHGTSCSFSDALGLAAEYAYRGEAYAPGAHASRCPGPPEPFDLSDKLNSDKMDRPLLSQR